MERGQILNVDTTKSEIQNPLVKLRQGDGNYQTLRVTVRNSGEPISLDGWTITFMGTTAGNHKIVDSKVLIEDPNLGIFSYTPTKAWGQDIGEFNKAYFKFTKNDEAASSATFRVNVLEAVDLTQEEAGDYISVVDTLIENVKNDMNTALSDTQITLAQAQSEAHSTSEAVSTYTSAANQAVSDVNSAASAATSSIGNQLEDFKTNDNTFTGKNTFTQLIEGSITGRAAVATTANDPNAVHLTSDQTVSGNNIFTGKNSFNGIPVLAQSTTVEFAMWYGSKIKATRFGNLVTLNYSVSPSQDIPSGVSSAQTIPSGFRPSFAVYMSNGAGSGGAVQVNPDGTLTSKGGISVAFPYAYTSVYFTNDSWPNT